MSNGVSRMWEEIAERELAQRKVQFESNSAKHFTNVADALEKLNRLSGLDLAMTKWQHQLMDDAIQSLSDCFKAKE